MRVCAFVAFLTENRTFNQRQRREKKEKKVNNHYGFAFDGNSLIQVWNDKRLTHFYYINSIESELAMRTSIEKVAWIRTLFFYIVCYSKHDVGPTASSWAATVAADGECDRKIVEWNLEFFPRSQHFYVIFLVEMKVDKTVHLCARTSYA